MLREKMYVEYPIAKTIREAIEFIKNGGEVQQECSDDFPSCGGFETVEDLIDNFPKEDWDYDADEQDLFLHLVPVGDDKEMAKPFRVGERVYAIKQFFLDNDTYMHKGYMYKILDISDDGKSLKLDTLKEERKNTDWPADNFCRCVLPVSTKQVYILTDVEYISIHSVYEDLSLLKEECSSDIAWSDDHSSGDAFSKLERSDLLSKWDIVGIDKETGKLRYGIRISLLKTN